MADSILTAFVLVAERCAQEHGAPLPKRILSLGDPDKGWGVRLNTTGEILDGVEPFSVFVTWNGWPAGMFDAGGGVVAAGAAANEAALCAWLREGLAPEVLNDLR